MTRQQQWSIKAHARVTAIRGEGEKVAAKYNTYARKMPSLIQRSGLIQALVFVESRKGAGEQFCDDLAHTYGCGGGREELRDRAQKAPLAEYLALSRDLAAVALWFRRFAQIELADLKDEEE